MFRGDTLLLPTMGSTVDHLTKMRMKPSNGGGARRCLFGQPDRSLTSSLIREQLDREREYMIQKWDYDPSKDEPVVPAKRYPWEPVARPVDEGGVAEETKAGSPEEKGSVSTDKPTPSKQLKITDFWRKRKLEEEATSHQKMKKKPRSQPFALADPQTKPPLPPS